MTEHENSKIKYWALIAVSPSDQKWGNWLLREIESYRVPGDLVGLENPDGGSVPHRIVPVFLARGDELDVSSNATGSIKNVIRACRYLIVFCSRTSAKSLWINNVIEEFRNFGRDDHIVPLVIDGQANSSDLSNECLPGALRSLELLLISGIEENVKAKKQAVDLLIGRLIGHTIPTKRTSGLGRLFGFFKECTQIHSVDFPAQAAKTESPSGVKLRQIDFLDFGSGEHRKTISLWEGDLARLPRNAYADFVVVSAFSGSYEPVPGSLIGAFAERNLSLRSLSENKSVDLLDWSGFWVSQELEASHPDLNIGRIICFEPERLGEAPQVVGDLFRGLFPLLDLKRNPSVALPLIGTGYQQWDSEVMLRNIVEAAVHWMRNGLPIRELRIVLLAEAAKWAKERPSPLQDVVNGIGSNEGPLHSEYDVFVSYSSKDAMAKEHLVKALREAESSIRIFDFRREIDVGQSYQVAIDRSIERCKRVSCILTPSYFRSNECLEELNIARLRNKRESTSVLLPIYWESCPAELALWIQTLNLFDARPQQELALRSYAEKLCMQLRATKSAIE